MEPEAHTAAFIEDVLGFVGPQILAIDRYLSGQLDRREEPATPPRNQNQAGNQQEDFELEGKQAVLFRQVAQRVQRGMKLQAAASDEEWDTLRAKVAEAAHRPIVCSGRPGTGKSTVLHRNVRATLAAGGSVLIALPTARLSNRMAEKLGSHAQLVVDTAAAAFQFHKPEQETLYAMHGYSLVVVDEFSQLGQPHFERILRQWHAADQSPALVFLGDKYQLPGVDPVRPWDSPAWKPATVQFVELTVVYRTHDEDFLQMLDILRTSMPTKAQLNKICRNRKAWKGDEPDARDIGRLLRTYPEAIMVAATRAGVAQVNRLALEALHPRAQPLTVLPGAIEDNPDNYDKGKLRDDRLPQPSEVPIHRGLKLYLTRNVRKADDFINGMLCEVLSYDEAAGALWVRTKTGKRLPITKWSDPDHPGLRFFPVRLGYCTTIHKVQGDEFDFIIIYLDAANMPAVGYTALSRVKDGRSYLLGGQLAPEHFVPVTMR
jgi:ATP-dependent exoDNAse (exonuclease V) alpha subunit